MSATAIANHRIVSENHSSPSARSVSKSAYRIGLTMSVIAILFLAFDSVVKLMKLAVAVEGTAQLGYPEGAVLGIGIVELACVLIYSVRRTSVFGAILLTGYLGGAIATHVRVGSPLFTHVLFPIYIALLVWGGLFLREDALRRVLIGERRDRRSGAPATAEGRKNRMNVALWIIQVLLALLFLFAGGTKLLVPLDVLLAAGPPNQVQLPGWFLHFIGGAEVLGALGLILPGIFRTKRFLTLLAAAGLVIIMIGATGITLASGDVAPALIPLCVGLLAGFVAYGRRNSR